MFKWDDESLSLLAIDQFFDLYKVSVSLRRFLILFIDLVDQA